MNSIVFETTRIIGDTIKLTQENFENHIIAHHPEMEGHEQDIKNTIEKNEKINIPKPFDLTEVRV